MLRTSTETTEGRSNQVAFEGEMLRVMQPSNKDYKDALEYITARIQKLDQKIAPEKKLSPSVTNAAL